MNKKYIKPHPFYCQRVSGDVNFSIKEWNEQYKQCLAAGIKMPSDDLPGCEQQCFECMAIVGETRLKNNKL